MLCQYKYSHCSYHRATTPDVMLVIDIAGEYISTSKNTKAVPALEKPFISGNFQNYTHELTKGPELSAGVQTGHVACVGKFASTDDRHHVVVFRDTALLTEFAIQDASLKREFNADVSDTVGHSYRGLRGAP